MRASPPVAPTSRCGHSAPGPTLVLLPGLGRSGHDLDAFAVYLVAAGYRVLLPEPRGMGASTGSLDGITLHDLARDIAAVIETLCDGPAVVIGHAFGNRIARCLAADRPALVDLVVLLSSSGKVQPTPEIAEAIRLAQAVDTPADIRAEAVRAAWFAPGSDIAPWLDGWSQPVMRAYLAAAAATPVDEWWTAGIGGGADRAGPVRCQRAGRQRPIAARGDRRAGHADRACRCRSRAARRTARAGGKYRHRLHAVS